MAVVVDPEVLDAINLGHAEAANVLATNARWRGTPLYVDKGSMERRVEADQEIMNDLRIFQEGSSASLAFSRARERYQNERPSRLDRFAESKRGTAALLYYLKEQGHYVELLTTNRAFQDAWVQAGGNLIRRMPAVTGLTGAPDYDRARRLLLLTRPLNVAANGRVLPTAVPPPPPSPRTRNLSVGPDGKVLPPGSPLGKITDMPNKGYGWGKDGQNGFGKPIERIGERDYNEEKYLLPGRGAPSGIPDRVHSKMSVNDARFQKYDVGFRGLNTVVQWLNGLIQSNRYEAQWNELAPQIAAHRTLHPSQGALVLVYYSMNEKKGAQKESGLQHTDRFNAIHVVYGETEVQALGNVKPAALGYDRLGIGNEIPKKNRFWIPPLKQVSIAPAAVHYEQFDFDSIKTPFPKWGLATFVSGLEEVVRVKFSRAMGFDDKLSSVERVDIRPGLARFIVLDPPGAINYMIDGKPLPATIWLDHAHAAQYADHDLVGSLVPVVKLDSPVNPYNAEAAMVFPANEVTVKAFEKTRATDTGGLFVDSGSFMANVRWVKAHKMRILRTTMHDAMYPTGSYSHITEEILNASAGGGRQTAREAPARVVP